MEEEKLKIFDEMDMDKSGFVSFHEVKVYLTRKMIAIG
jgi:Ca2+-binding EF-hand superfamily protein